MILIQQLISQSAFNWFPTPKWKRKITEMRRKKMLACKFVIVFGTGQRTLYIEISCTEYIFFSLSYDLVYCSLFLARLCLPGVLQIEFSARVYWHQHFGWAIKKTHFNLQINICGTADYWFYIRESTKKKIHATKDFDRQRTEWHPKICTRIFFFLLLIVNFAFVSRT